MLMGAVIGAAVGVAVFLISKQMKPKNDGSTLDAGVKQDVSKES